MKKVILIALMAVWASVANAWTFGTPDGPSPYLGQVATRSYVPMSFNGSNHQMQSRTTHWARANITSLQLVIPNFYVSPGSGEVASGADASTTATIEYPAATFTRVTFSGSNTGTVPNGGLLASDATAVTIPYGAQFFVRIWWSGSGGLVFWGTTAASMVSTDGFAFGNTTPDLTGGGTVSANTTTGFFPAAIIGQTTRPTLFLAGDSRVQGTQSAADSYGDVGQFARSVGPSLAYINAGISGETGANALIHYTNRLALSAYTSHILVNYGINDITGGASAATLAGTINSFIALFPVTKEVWPATLPPVSTSTDSWATTGNQTTEAHNAARVTYNTSLRTGGTIVGSRGYVEIANSVESALNSGLWAAPGYTPDGTHETQLGTLKIQADGGVPVQNFGR